MSNVRDLHRKWSRNPDYRKAYGDLDFEFTFARSLIEARVDAKGISRARRRPSSCSGRQIGNGRIS